MEESEQNASESKTLNLCEVSNDHIISCLPVFATQNLKINTDESITALVDSSIESYIPHSQHTNKLHPKFKDKEILKSIFNYPEDNLKSNVYEKAVTSIGIETDSIKQKDSGVQVVTLKYSKATQTECEALIKSFQKEKQKLLSTINMLKTELNKYQKENKSTQKSQYERSHIKHLKRNIDKSYIIPDILNVQQTNNDRMKIFGLVTKSLSTKNSSLNKTQSGFNNDFASTKKIERTITIPELKVEKYKANGSYELYKMKSSTSQHELGKSSKPDKIHKERNKYVKQLSHRELKHKSTYRNVSLEN